MGCDIHLHLEYSPYGKPSDGRPQYWAYMGELYPGRSYGVFAGMAGVRGHFDWTIEPKGYPRDIGWWTASELFLAVVDDADATKDTRHRVGRTQAQKWLDSGFSKSIVVARDNTEYITRPDYHTPSWLSTAEYKKIINELDRDTVGSSFLGILAMMETMEQTGSECRLVFAFDI
jgi:hypothetical protein